MSFTPRGVRGREGSPIYQQPTAVTQKHKFGKYHHNQIGEWVTERGIICSLSQSQAKALTMSENCPSLSSLLFHSNTIKTAPFHVIYLYGPSMSRPNVQDENKSRAAVEIYSRFQNPKSHNKRTIFMLTENIWVIWSVEIFVPLFFFKIFFFN